MRTIAAVRYITIHHSGVPMDSSAEDIARYHIEVMSWPGPGYHFLVHQDGRIEQLQDIHNVSYHVAGRNEHAIGICLTGDFTAQAPGPKQLESARLLVAWLLSIELPGRAVVGHRDLALPHHATACPGDTWPNWKEAIGG